MKARNWIHSSPQPVLLGGGTSRGVTPTAEKYRTQVTPSAGPTALSFLTGQTFVQTKWDSTWQRPKASVWWTRKSMSFWKAQSKFTLVQTWTSKWRRKEGISNHFFWTGRESQRLRNSPKETDNHQGWGSDHPQCLEVSIQCSEYNGRLERTPRHWA